MKQKVDILIYDAKELLTLIGSERPRRGAFMKDLTTIENGAVAIKDGIIIDVGKNITNKYRAETFIDASNKIVMPGFVDSHTHLVFYGIRAEEIEMRIQNFPKEEIEKKFGIHYTVEKTRKARKEELSQLAAKTLDIMLLNGTTTIEAKSGYGLTHKDEMKILEVIHNLAQSHPIDIVPTFLGAHKVPREGNEKE